MNFTKRTPSGAQSTSVRIGATAYRRLRRLAKREQRSFQAVVERALERYEKEGDPS